MNQFPVTEFESFLNDNKKLRMVKNKGPWHIELLPDEKPYHPEVLLKNISNQMYLIGDLHIGDPIENWTDKRDKIIATINATVSKDDHLLIVGDLSAHTNTANIDDVRNTIAMLNCRNLYLILGNNDQYDIDTYVKMGFLTVTDKVYWKNYVITHCPITVYGNQINIHGHMHEEIQYINVDWHNHINIWDDQYVPIKLGKAIELFNSGYYKGVTINDKEELEYHKNEKYFGTEESVVTENFIFNKNNLYINFDKFESGKSNICLVTGLSGSGKSTLAKSLVSKYKAEWIELDMFECCYSFETDEQLKEAGEVFYEYLSNHKTLWGMLKNRQVKGKALSDECKRFFEYCISWCRKHKENKWVIEGVQIYSFADPSKVKSIPTVFVNASMLKSITQRWKRNGDGKINLAKELKDEFPQMLSWYIDNEREFNSFQKAVLNETPIRESAIPDEYYSDKFSDAQSVFNTLSEREAMWYVGRQDYRGKKSYVDAPVVKYRSTLIKNQIPVGTIEVRGCKGIEYQWVGVFIGKDYRHQGYSKILFNHMLDDYKPKGKIRWHVEFDNKVSQHTAESLGFKQVPPKLSDRLKKYEMIIEESYVSQLEEQTQIGLKTNYYMDLFNNFCGYNSKTSSMLYYMSGNFNLCCGEYLFESVKTVEPRLPVFNHTSYMSDTDIKMASILSGDYLQSQMNTLVNYPYDEELKLIDSKDILNDFNNYLHNSFDVIYSKDIDSLHTGLEKLIKQNFDDAKEIYRRYNRTNYIDEIKDKIYSKYMDDYENLTERQVLSLIKLRQNIVKDNLCKLFNINERNILAPEIIFSHYTSLSFQERINLVNSEVESILMKVSPTNNVLDLRQHGGGVIYFSNNEAENIYNNLRRPTDTDDIKVNKQHQEDKIKIINQYRVHIVYSFTHDAVFVGHSKGNFMNDLSIHETTINGKTYELLGDVIDYIIGTGAKTLICVCCNTNPWFINKIMDKYGDSDNGITIELSNGLVAMECVTDSFDTDYSIGMYLPDYEVLKEIEYVNFDTLLENHDVLLEAIKKPTDNYIEGLRAMKQMFTLQISLFTQYISTLESLYDKFEIVIPLLNVDTNTIDEVKFKDIRGMKAWYNKSFKSILKISNMIINREISWYNSIDSNKYTMSAFTGFNW